MPIHSQQHSKIAWMKVSNGAGRLRVDRETVTVSVN